MDMNYWVILWVTIVVFMGGALWYGPLFGNTWMKILGMEWKSKEQLKEATKGMWKLLLTEFITTFMLMTTLAFLVTQIQWYRAIAIAFFVWLGFALPMIVSDVIWGGDKKEWICTKITIMLSFRFIALMFAGFIYWIWL